MGRETNMSIRISVVIPLYNKQATIRRAIDSVIEQLDEGDELIVVDDGSTDGGVDEIENYLFEPSFVNLVRQKNQGVSVARNEGIRRAHNENVVLLDADDWWLDGVREKFAELIHRWPGAQAWSIGHYRADGKERMYINSGLDVDRFLQGPDFVSHYGKFSGTINSSTVCLRKAAFLEAGGFPEGVTSGEDVYLWLWLGLQGGIGVSPSPLVCIDRPLSGRPEKKGRDVVGFHYLYFGDRGNFERLTQRDRSAIKGFLARNGIRQIAGSVAGGDRSSALQKAKVIGSVVPWIPLFALVVLIFPKRVLAWAFRWRHTGPPGRRVQ